MENWLGELKKKKMINNLCNLMNIIRNKRIYQQNISNTHIFNMYLIHYTYQHRFRIEINKKGIK